MSQTVDVAFVQAFQDTVQILAQQKPSKFRDAVRFRTGVVGKYDHFERLGGAELGTVIARHSPHIVLNPEHSRRRAIFVDKDGTVLLDTFDQVKMLIDPQSEYAQLLSYATNRAIDSTILTAAIASATAVSAADATSAVTLASWKSGVHVIANGGTNMTMAKLRLAKRRMDEDDVEEEDRHLAISPAGLDKLLSDSTVTSSDFNTIRALVNGEINTYLGFMFHKTTMLALAGNIRSCIAWQKQGIGCSLGLEVVPEIDRRVDLAGNPIQVAAKLSLGGVRIEEARVVQIDIDESA